MTFSATVSTSDPSLTGTDKTGATLLGNDLLIGLDITATRTSNVSLDLNSAVATDAPIGFDKPVAAALTAKLKFSFSFGLDLTGYLDSQAAAQPSGGSPLSSQFVFNAEGNTLARMPTTALHTSPLQGM